MYGWEGCENYTVNICISKRYYDWSMGIIVLSFPPKHINWCPQGWPIFWLFVWYITCLFVLCDTLHGMPTMYEWVYLYALALSNHPQQPIWGFNCLKKKIYIYISKSSKRKCTNGIINFTCHNVSTSIEKNVNIFLIT